MKEFRVIRKLPRNGDVFVGRILVRPSEAKPGLSITKTPRGESLLNFSGVGFFVYGEKMIQIYTGNGKGKTTAAIGLAIRALGHNKNVSIIQFFKDKKFYGEQKVLKHLKNLKIYSFASKHPHFYKNIKIEDIKNECEKALEKIAKIIKEKKCDLLILDELNIAIRDKYIDVEKIVRLLKNKPKKMEIVITGRNAHKKILKLADLITDMRLVKHPYYTGIKSRKGIEY